MQISSCLLSFCLFALTMPLAAVVVPNDVPYFKAVDPKVDIIYSKRDEAQIPMLLTYAHRVIAHYERSFGYTLQDKPTIILTSQKNQVPNAYASTLPGMKNVYFAGGGPSSDNFTSVSWVKFLIVHEIAHLFQTDAKSKVSEIFRNIFGHTTVFFLFPLPPIFIYPNHAAPTFLLEGNAVLNESLFGLGGRLYSGPFKALFYTLVKAGLLDQTRLINDHLFFPFGSEPYITGAFFNLYLAKKYGVDKVNHYFKEHGEHYINPLRVNRSFSDHFGHSFQEEVNQFLVEAKALADQQKETSQKPLVTSVVDNPLSKQKDKIYFLSQSDGKSPAALHIYDLKTKTLNTRVSNISSGKVFLVDGEIAATDFNSDRSDWQIVFGLWTESFTLLPDSKGKYVMVKEGDFEVAFDLDESLEGDRLLVNGKFFAKANSQAIADQNRSIYYFVQNKDTRTLYKDKTPLFSYKGYYGEPMDVDTQGNIYFIANTEVGSSLFCYRLQKKKIERVLASDTIIGAVLVDESTFLVSEVFEQGYSYKLAEAKKPLEQDPHFAELGLKSYSEIFDAPPSIGVMPNIESYNSLTGLDFSSWTFSYGTSSKDQDSLYVEAGIVDALEQNTLTPALTTTQNHEDLELSFAYQNMLKFVSWALEVDLFNYTSGKVRSAKEKAGYLDGQYYRFAAAFSLPFFRHERWFYTLTNIHSWDERYVYPYKGILGIDVSRTEVYSNSFYAYSRFNLKLSGLATRLRKEQELQTYYYQDLGYENILGVEIIYRRTNANSLDWGNNIYGAGYRILSVPDDIYSVGPFSVTKYSAEYSKVINYSKYFFVLPFALRRFAPSLYGTYLSREGDRLKDDTEVGGRLAVDVLFAHNVPLVISGSYTQRQSDEANAFILSGLASF